MSASARALIADFTLRAEAAMTLGLVCSPASAPVLEPGAERVGQPVALLNHFQALFRRASPLERSAHQLGAAEGGTAGGDYSRSAAASRA